MTEVPPNASITKQPTLSSSDSAVISPILVVLPGLGFAPSVWDVLRPDLEQDFQVIAVPLPGFGGGTAPPPEADIEQWLEALMPRLPDTPACYLGWSLGGLLAMALCTRAPERVLGLITLASNPRFCRDRSWRTGLPQQWFGDFKHRAAVATESALQRLVLLSAHGDAAPRPLATQLRSHVRPGDSGAFASGLSLLQHSDLRTALSTLTNPSLHLLGGRDALVPATLATPLRRLVGGAQRIAVLPTASHAALLSQPAPVLGALRAFAHDHDILSTPQRRPTPTRVAQHFNTASASYDRAARLQRKAGRWLLETLPKSLEVTTATSVQHRAERHRQTPRILDLGCGTGHFLSTLAAYYPSAQLFAIDRSFSMTQRAATRVPKATPPPLRLCATAESLPLANASIDVVFCNLMLQWCAEPLTVLRDIQRVLRPSGWLLFTTFGPDTLWQLRAAFLGSGQRQPVLGFQPAAFWQQTAATAGLRLHDWSERNSERSYPNVRSLLQELRQLGATASATQPPGLSGRATQRRMAEVAAHLSHAHNPSFSFQLFRATLQKL